MSQATLNRLDDVLDLCISEGPAEVAAPDDGWGMGKQMRPADRPYFAMNWAAQMHAAGVGYDLLMDWFRAHAYHRRPLSFTDVLTANLGTRATPEQPLPVTLGMTRLDDETAREHLLRVGRQCPVYDVPDRRVTHTDRPYESLFFFKGAGGTPSTDIQHVIAESPLSVDRAALLQRRATPISVLHILARDPNPLIRCAAARHRKANAAVLARFAEPGHIETDIDVVTSIVTSRRANTETLLALIEPSGLPITGFVAQVLAEHPDPRIADLGCRRLAVQGRLPAVVR